MGRSREPRDLFARALARQEAEWEDQDESLGPNLPLLELQDLATSDDLADLWAEFADGDQDQRILLTRVCGEAAAPLPVAVEEGLLTWIGQPVEPPLLTWVVSRLAYRPRPPTGALRPALRQLAHPHAEVRYALTGLLAGYVPEPAALNGLLTLAQDDDADVRFGAIFELHAHASDAELSDPRVDVVLRKAAEDPDARVRDLVGSA